MQLSVLALAIYDILRDLVPDASAEITYEELVNRLGPMPPPNEGLHYRDPRLDAALGELVIACRGRDLPAISALVIRKIERNPGAGYYPTAHPTEWRQDQMLAEVAWANERERAWQTSYPAQLVVGGRAEPGAAADGGGHVGFWEFELAVAPAAAELGRSAAEGFGGGQPMSAGFAVDDEVFWGTNGAVEAYVDCLAALAIERFGPGAPLGSVWRITTRWRWL